MKRKINTDLLVAVTSIQSSYIEDSQINKFIEDYLSKISGVVVSKDDFGNIYATKGKGEKGYKCIVAHTDTVHSIYKNRKIYIHDNVLFAMASTDSKVNSPLAQVGIGGDDKSGVYAALEAVSEFDNIKAVFFRFEESGCKGSRAADMKFFDDCNFVVQLDRRGNSDFITHTNGIKVASKEFDKAMEAIYKKYGFSSVIGVSTDVGALKSNGLKVSACNISAGYFDPHSRFEVIDMNGLHNSYLMVCEMFEQYGETRFDHEYIKPVSTYSSWGSRLFGNQPKQLSMFSNNYFTNTLKAIDSQNYSIVSDGRSPRFMKAPRIHGWPDTYKFIDNDMIDVDAECPHCGAKDMIAYLTEDKAFLCMESGHNEWVADPELHEKLKITENGITYVYNRLYDVWLDERHASWSEEFETYVVK